MWKTVFSVRAIHREFLAAEREKARCFSVGAMEKLRQLGELQRQVAAAQRHGADLLSEAFGVPAEQLPLEKELARRVARAAEHFSGPAYSRYKKRALEAARRNRHGLNVLILIAERARTLGIKHRYVFTEQLCNTAGDLTAISRRATQLRRRMQGPRVPDDGGRRILHGTKTTIQFTGPAHEMSEIWESARLDPLAWLTENRTIQRSTLTTNVVVELDEYMQVLSGQGDEVELRATNGAVLTGAEYVARRLAEASGVEPHAADLSAVELGASELSGVDLRNRDYITLISAEQGPVNLYRVRRLASQKQRRMLEAETTQCAWPGCGRPASECQVHHLQEFARGGETNPENMSLLCPYHNGVNGQPNRGRMARVSGRVTWLPPGRAAPKDAQR